MSGRTMQRAWARWGELFHSARARRARELAEELESHLALHAAEYERGGMTAEEARRRARIKLGGLDATAEACRDRRGLRWLEEWGQDARYGLRQMRKAHAFSAAAIITLALGLGATTAVFSLLQATLLEPLPYPHAQRLMSVEALNRRGRSHGIDFGLARTLEHRASLLHPLAIYTSLPAHVKYRQHTWNSMIEVTTPELFQLTATQAARGRLFDAGDTGAGRPVAVISHGFWRETLHGNPHAVGETLGISQGHFTIIGILPTHARFPFLSSTPQVWLPLSPAIITNSLLNLNHGIAAGWSFYVLGRLLPGATRAAAEAQIETRFQAWLHARHITLYHAQHTRLSLEPLAGSVSRPYRRPLLLLLLAAGLLLLIACVNLANLLSARISARRLEIATRAMLGAGRRELTRQWIIENLLLALPGAAAGWGLAAAALRLSRSELPLGLRPTELALEPTVLLAALGAGVAIALLLALLPAWQLRHWAGSGALPIANSSYGESRRPRRLRQSLTVAEIALSFLLLLSAGLLLHSLLRTLQVRPGFNPRHLLDAYIQLPLYKYKTHTDWTRFTAEELTRLRARPEVASAAAAVTPPMLSGGVMITQTIQGFGAQGASGHAIVMALQPISPGYFTTMQIPLLGGRDFRASDNAKSRRVCIINQALARRAFPGRNPLGKKLGNDIVVGLVGNTINQSLTRTPSSSYFVPLAQYPVPFLHFLARTKISADSFEPEMRKSFGAHYNGLPIIIRPVESEIAHDATLSAERVHAGLTSLLGLLGLAVTGMGIYSLLAYGITQRRHEIGVRSALGATRGQLVNLIIQEGLKLTLAGGLIGLAAAWAFGSLLSSLLFQVSPDDFWSYLTAAMLLVGISLAASYLPARRAARLDPLEALRYE